MQEKIFVSLMRLTAVVMIVFCELGCASLKNKSNDHKDIASAPVAPVSSSAFSNQPAQSETAAGIQSGAAPRVSKNAVYNLPIATNPQGQFRIESVGLVDLRNGSSNDVLPVLHLRLIVKNDSSDLDWGVDARLQQLKLSGLDPLRPSFVRASGQNPPFIEVAKGHTQNIDLFYALPAERRSANDLQSYGVDWQVTTGDRQVNQTTTFASIERESGNSVVIPSRPEATNSQTATSSGSTSSPINDVSSREWWADPYSRLPDPWRARTQ